MIYHDLNEKNFLLFAMQHYDNPQCVEVEEFNDDLRKIKYIKRLFNQYHIEGTLKERLILNHLIVFYNGFPVKVATRILFLKLEEHFWPILKTFLVYLHYMPEEKIESINGKEIIVSDVPMDQLVIDRLREFDRNAIS